MVKGGKRMIKITEVLFVNPADPDFKPYVENQVVVNGELAMDFYGESWLCRTITGEREGVPVVDLSKCRSVEIITKESLTELSELISLPFVEALKQLAR